MKKKPVKPEKSTDPGNPGEEIPVCDLCGDQKALWLESGCHFTAPLAARLEGEWLIISCYVPECNREVARFKVTTCIPAP